jgi:hypothetical protein
MGREEELNSTYVYSSSVGQCVVREEDRATREFEKGIGDQTE